MKLEEAIKRAGYKYRICRRAKEVLVTPDPANIIFSANDVLADDWVVYSTTVTKRRVSNVVFNENSNEITVVLLEKLPQNTRNLRATIEWEEDEPL